MKTSAQNLTHIDQEQAFTLTKFFIRTKGNIFLFGQKGTGKTKISLQAIKDCGFKPQIVNLSVVERPDLSGFPDLKNDSDIVHFKSPHFLPKLKENQKPDQVILFDEVDKAAPEITAPLLEILQFKKINGSPLNVAACVLTGNLLNEGAYSNSISTALLDRGAKFILKFDFEKWFSWAKENEIHDLILGFLRSNPELTCGKEDDLSFASPSPRGWTQASEALIEARNLKITDIDSIFQIVSGFVGNEAGTKFRVWFEHFRHFEPFIHVLIEKGNLKGLDFSKLLPTEKIIFVISVCHFAKQKFLESGKGKNKFSPLENLCKFFKDWKVDPEIQMLGMSGSFSFEMITKHKVYECKPFFELFNSLSEKIGFLKG